jgi:hypothetical protein
MTVNYSYFTVSLFGSATGYWLDGRGSIPGRRQIFLYSAASIQAIQLVPGARFPRVKRPGCEGNYSPQFSGEVALYLQAAMRLSGMVLH